MTACVGNHPTPSEDEQPTLADVGYVCTTCGRDAVARGLCARHYDQAWRAGTLAAHERISREEYNRRLKRASTLIERFLSKFEQTPGSCWIWTGTVLSTGYGQINDRGKRHSAHRLSYEHFIGPIPAGLTIDHLCRVPACVNPEHLEPVTSVENVMRAPGSVGAANKAKPDCPKCGGPYVKLGAKGDRVCPPCRAEYQRQYRARRRADV